MNKQTFNTNYLGITVVLFLVLVLAGPVFVFAQKKFMSIGPEIGLPGKYDQSYENRGTGIGGSFRFEIAWSKHISGIATIGYLSFAKASPFDDSPTYTNQVNTVPIQFGIKYYLQKQNKISKGFFLSGETGIMPTITHVTFTNGAEQKTSEFCISAALGAGYMFKHIELSSRLQWNLSNTGFHVYYYNFRVAYAF